MRLIDADALMRRLCVQCDVESHEATCDPDECFVYNVIVYDAPTIEAEPVRHGTWKLEAHNERVNYRWNVTAKCPECGHEKGEIYAGFFPGVPDSIAEAAIISNAESVKLDNYCPNCGVKMDGGGSCGPA